MHEMRKFYKTELMEKHLLFYNHIEDDNVDKAQDLFENPFLYDSEEAIVEEQFIF